MWRGGLVPDQEQAVARAASYACYFRCHTTACSAEPTRRAVMAKSDHNGRKVALVGGAGLAAWWLLTRGNGWGFRTSGDGSERTTPARRVVWVRRDRIEVDGVASDLATVLAKARASGEAEVHATGDAITRSVKDVVTGLRAAGVAVVLTGDLARTDWETL
jgi:hypothetical protein